MINRVILVGRLTKDPELRKTQSGLSTVSFILAVNRNIKKEGQQEADFVNCVAWRQTADFMVNYIKKGALIGVEGRIQTRNYEDNTGKRIYITEVVCDNVQSLESRREAPKTEVKPITQYEPPSATGDDYGNLNISADDLPF